MKKINIDLIKHIEKLRKSGYSYSEISKLVKISNTTVQRYAHNTKISTKHFHKWFIKRGGSIKRKQKKEQTAYSESQKLIKDFSYKESILYLSALYWAEGSKKDFCLSNSDPKLVRVFIVLLKNVFKIHNNQIRLSLRLYDDLNKDVCLNYWSDFIKLPKTNFISFDILYGKKKGKLKYGMCRIRVLKGGDFLKKVNSVNKIVGEILFP